MTAPGVSVRISGVVWGGRGAERGAGSKSSIPRGSHAASEDEKSVDIRTQQVSKWNDECTGRRAVFYRAVGDLSTHSYAI